MDSATKHCHIHGDLHRRRRRRTCIAATSAVIIFIALLLLILGLTVLRPRPSTTTVNSVHIAGLRAGLDPSTLSVDLNLTLDIDLTATNPNHASFDFSQGSAQLFYRGVLVGDASIPPGSVAAGGSVEIKVRLTLLAGRLVLNSGLYSDVTSGSVPITTDTVIPGKVTILGIFSHHMVTYTTCDVLVSVATRSVQNSDCRYRTKF